MPFLKLSVHHRWRSGLAAMAVAGATALAPAIVSAQTAPATPRPASPRPAQPAPAAPAPAAPAPAAQPGGPTFVQVKPEPSQPEWTKVCGKDPGNNKEICYTTRDFISEQGQPVLAVAVYDVKGDPTKIVRFLLPLGLQLVPGVRFNIDAEKPIDGKYAICFPNGCFAEAGVKEQEVNAMKRGTHVNVNVQNQVGRVVTFQVPLTGFAKAFDGAPIDPKVLEEQQKKLQEELQKRSDDLRRRIDQQGGAAAAPAIGGLPPVAAPKP